MFAGEESNEAQQDWLVGIVCEASLMFVNFCGTIRPRLFQPDVRRMPPMHRGKRQRHLFVCEILFQSELCFFCNGFILGRTVKSCRSDVRWAQPSSNKWQRRFLPSCLLFNLKRSHRKQKNRRTCEKKRAKTAST